MWCSFMATIVALCPYCRRGGVRASEKMVGAVATCPKCGSQFTVVPRDDSPAAPPPEETEAHAQLPDVTEPSPIVHKTKPSVSSETETKEGIDPVFAGSLIALSVFGLGVIGTQFPYGRFIGMGLCALGLVMGLGCLLGEGLARKLGAAAAVLNLIAVALLALAPTWLGFDPLSGAPASSMPQGPYSLSLSSNEVSGGDRINASKSVYANADVRVGIRSGGIQPVDLIGPRGAMRRTRENVLKLQVRITNAGVERRVPLSDWALGAPGEGVKLTDPAGKALKPKVFEPGWQPAGLEKIDGLFPGKSADVVLFFEPPPGSGPKGTKVEYLHLELPGSGVGLVETTIRFHVPL
jgi:hypothetical protein